MLCVRLLKAILFNIYLIFIYFILFNIYLISHKYSYILTNIYYRITCNLSKYIS